MVPNNTITFLPATTGFLVVDIRIGIRIRIKFTQQYNKDSKLFKDASICCAVHLIQISQKLLRGPELPKLSPVKGKRLCVIVLRERFLIMRPENRV